MKNVVIKADNGLNHQLFQCDKYSLSIGRLLLAISIHRIDYSELKDKLFHLKNYSNNKECSLVVDGRGIDKFFMNTFTIKNFNNHWKVEILYEQTARAQDDFADIPKHIRFHTEIDYDKLEIQLNTNQEETAMKTENIASMMIEGLKTVGVQFRHSGKSYTYKTMDTYEVGDYAVVHAQGDYKIVEVVAVHKVPQIDVDSNIKYAWVVQKIDLDAHSQMLEREQEFSEHLLELQQKSVRDNAATMLADKLGVSKDELLEASKVLTIEQKSDED